MKKSLLVTILFVSLTLAACADQGTESSQSKSGNTTQSQESSTIDLSGVWTHSNSASGEPGLEARIDGNVIEVKWLMEEKLGDGIFWVGSFDSIVPKKGKTTFSSVRDKVATEMEWMASTDEQKEFTYEKGKLKFPVTFQETTFEVEMKKTGELQGDEKVSSSAKEISFKNGVYTSPQLTINITGTRVIAVGKSGNEYGEKPVLAFYYEITNNSDEKVTPSDWITCFKAVQDNDTNKINQLKVAPHPDEELMSNQLSVIKKGGTLKGAVAYELTDETTPVQLVASAKFGTEEVGRETYQVK